MRAARCCAFAAGRLFVQAVERIAYAIPRHEGVPPRLWYYRWPLLHRLYEAAAYLRDWFRPASTP